jgi:hypothetical protein
MRDFMGSEIIALPEGGATLQMRCPAEDMKPSADCHYL